MGVARFCERAASGRCWRGKRTSPKIAALALCAALLCARALAGGRGGGDDDDDSDDGDDSAYAGRHVPVASFGKSEGSKRKQLMIVALSGTRAKDGPLRRGMLEGWANNDTWLVTKAKTSWPRVIRLPALSICPRRWVSVFR